MADWVSWEEAVAVVAIDFPADEAERLLHAAIREDGVVKVWAADEGGVHRAKWPGYGFVEAQPGQLPDQNNLRHYRQINYVDLSSLKLWLHDLTSDADKAISSRMATASAFREGGNAVPQAADGEVPGPTQSIETYRTGAPGRPTSVHLVEEELRRRANAGELSATLQSEAENLSKWLADRHPKAARMKAKSVANRCRDLFRELQKQAPK